VGVKLHLFWTSVSLALEMSGQLLVLSALLPQTESLADLSNKKLSWFSQKFMLNRTNAGKQYCLTDPPEYQLV